MNGGIPLEMFFYPHTFFPSSSCSFTYLYRPISRRYLRCGMTCTQFMCSKISGTLMRQYVQFDTPSHIIPRQKQPAKDSIHFLSVDLDRNFKALFILRILPTSPRLPVFDPLTKWEECYHIIRNRRLYNKIVQS